MFPYIDFCQNLVYNNYTFNTILEVQILKRENKKCLIWCFLNTLIFWTYLSLPDILFRNVSLGWGESILIGVAHLFVSLCVIVPIMSWMYAKKAIKCNRMKYICCICYALVFVLPNLVLGNDNVVLFTTPILFTWVLLWEMLPVMVFELKSRKKH